MNYNICICFYICCSFITVFSLCTDTFEHTTTSCPVPKKPTISTKYGPVVGLTQTSRHGRSYTSFRGIPYAKPPVGELRFAAPEPPEPWTSAINATEEAPFCIQKNYFFANPKVEGQEDCLYLNIYVPEVCQEELLPIMVFIHWGGFFAGRGTSDYIGPEYLMDKDIILVTFNYRLGVFGFFSTLDDSAPGNFGLKDQVLALKFVRENIGYFGGDKNRVTVFGQSAGGGSVSLHLISPLSKGLFQQAISQSGTGLNIWAKPLNALQSMVIPALASFVGCGDQLGNNSNLVQCLRNVEAFDLVKSGDKFKTFSIEPLTPYTVVTEKRTTSNPKPFITKDPLQYLQAGEFQKVPWIVGNVQDEGIIRVSQLVRQPEVLKQLNENFATSLPQLMYLQVSVKPNSTEDLPKKLIDFYLGGETSIDINNPNSVQGFINLYTDRAFTYGTFQSVILQSQKEQQPIWLYNFNYRGEHTYGDLFAATNNDINFTWGVSHCDDLLYLFKSPALFSDLVADIDLLMSEKLLTLWTNFAIHGDPDPHQSVQWKSLNFSSMEEIKSENLVFLNITGNHTSPNITFDIHRGFYLERMKFWINLDLAENFPGLF